MTQYRDLIDRIAEETEAEAVVLVVLGGTRGSGVVVKIAAPSTAEVFAQAVPEIAECLHNTATQLLADALTLAQQRSTGN